MATVWVNERKGPKDTVLINMRDRDPSNINHCPVAQYLLCCSMVGLEVRHLMATVWVNKGRA